MRLAFLGGFQRKFFILLSCFALTNILNVNTESTFIGIGYWSVPAHFAAFTMGTHLRKIDFTRAKKLMNNVYSVWADVTKVNDRKILTFFEFFVSILILQAAKFKAWNSLQFFFCSFDGRRNSFSKRKILFEQY